jgi:predicted RNA-binding protein with TRAM domain
MSHVYVELTRDEDGYPPFEIEEIDAAPLGSGRFRIDGIPVFVYGLAKGDVVKGVRVTGEDERIWVSEVLEPGGHWVARVLPADKSALDRTADRFTDIGCHANSTPFGLVAVDVPPKTSADAVMKVLEDGRSAGEWDFDLGVLPN